MKFFKTMFLLFLIGLLSFGCAKKSGIEGKVVDGKGQPIAGVKIIAKQVQPIKGYEQFETKTNSDGNFSFKGVYPASEYIVKAEGAAEEKIQSGPEGQISMLPSPIEVRFTVSSDGVIKDSKTGLQWAQDAGGQQMNWFQANDYVQNLKIGGYSDWRLPSKEELESLISFSTGKGINEMGFKNVQPSGYWSSTTYAGLPSFAWYVDFGSGDVYGSYKGSGYYVRCVRGGQ